MSILHSALWENSKGNGKMFFFFFMDPQGNGTAGTTNLGAVSLYFNLRNHVITSFNLNATLDMRELMFFFSSKNRRSQTQI